MLLKNKSLKELCLAIDSIQYGSIGEEGTQKLIQSFTYNTTVKKLELPLNYKSSIDSSVDSRVIFTKSILRVNVPVIH